MLDVRGAVFGQEHCSGVGCLCVDGGLQGRPGAHEFLRGEVYILWAVDSEVRVAETWFGAVSCELTACA